MFCRASTPVGARHHDHTTPVLTTLHRLPVRKRVTFKLLLLLLLMFVDFDDDVALLLSTGIA